MTMYRWLFSYDIKKVNGDSYLKNDDLVREHEENIPRIMKEGAQRLVDQFDFASVKIHAKNLDTGETYEYTEKSDWGTRDEWISPPRA